MHPLETWQKSPRKNCGFSAFFFLFIFIFFGFSPFIHSYPLIQIFLFFLFLFFSFSFLLIPGIFIFWPMNDAFPFGTIPDLMSDSQVCTAKRRASLFRPIGPQSAISHYMPLYAQFDYLMTEAKGGSRINFTSYTSLAGARRFAIVIFFHLLLCYCGSMHCLLYYFHVRRKRRQVEYI